MVIVGKLALINRTKSPGLREETNDQNKIKKQQQQNLILARGGSAQNSDQQYFFVFVCLVWQRRNGGHAVF